MSRKPLDQLHPCDRISLSLPRAMANTMRDEQLRMGYPTLSEFIREIWKAYKKTEALNEIHLVDHLRYRENTAADRLRGTTMRAVRTTANVATSRKDGHDHDA